MYKNIYYICCVKLHLPNVTIICVACTKLGESVTAIYKCLEKVVPAKAVLISDIKVNLEGIESVQLEKKLNWKEYNNFIVKELYKYFDTDYCLIVQHDGYILDENQWNDTFLDYDYIGAPWLYTDGRNVGNGGFSLRSRKLQKLLGEDDFIEMTCPEDEIICRLYRHYLEGKGMVFADDKTAQRFSYELNPPLKPTFGFHGKHHQPYKPAVVISRSHALGDVLTAETLLEYYHKKGYYVVLDTEPQYQMLFFNHFYPVYQKSQLHGDVEYLHIDLNKAYEINPKKLHLQSYYDIAGIMDGKIRNPKLNFPITKDNKLFKKYAVLHIDKRNEPYRNIYGVNWNQVVEYLKVIGYDTILVGNGKREYVEGALEMKTQTINMLMYLVAGADLFIGIDSGISHIASAFNIPSVIFFGSVNPDYIHADHANKVYIHNHDKKVCEKPFCWHDSIGETGTKCYLENVPCTKYTTNQVYRAIESLISKPRK